MKHKLCPLMAIANAMLEATAEYEEGVLAPACEEERCTWWDREVGMCAVVRLSQVANAFDPESSCIDIHVLK